MQIHMYFNNMSAHNIQHKLYSAVHNETFKNYLHIWLISGLSREKKATEVIEFFMWLCE